MIAHLQVQVPLPSSFSHMRKCRHGFGHKEVDVWVRGWGAGGEHNMLPATGPELSAASEIQAVMSTRQEALGTQPEHKTIQGDGSSLQPHRADPHWLSIRT